MTQVMLICHGCGRRVFDEKEKCPNCGSLDFEREKIVATSILKNVSLCRACESPVLDGDLGCPNCGAGRSKRTTITPLLMFALACALAALGVFIYLWTL